MTLRFLAVFLGIALILGHSIPTLAQQRGQSATARKNRNARSSPPKATSESKNSSEADSAGTAGTSTESTDTDKKDDAKAKPKLEKATFGGGCFWCMEAVFERIPGVKSVVSGYSGGSIPNPSYEMVHTGLTGHAEVIQIVFDSEVIPFEHLLDYFWISHDPTTLNRQGPDIGTQYRSVIFYHSKEQKEAALKSYQKVTASGAFASPIVTQLVPFTKFYPAERYHQNYYRNNRNAPYCQDNIVPKLMKLQYKLRSEQMQQDKK